jgi:Kdo2-lipid IVA lauroyltransferase/acyltransferase
LQTATPEQIQASLIADPNSETSLRKLATDGRGFLIATGHFGNWELLGAWLVQRPVNLTVVYKPMHNPYTNQYLHGIRRGWGENVISTRARAPRALITALRQGQGVAIAADQDAGNAGEFIPFFGRAASTATGLAALAVRLNVPILVGFVVRERPGRFRYQTQAILEPDPLADPNAEIQRIMLTYHRGLEEIIRTYPEQYFWWHKRWKTQPRKTSLKKK